VDRRMAAPICIRWAARCSVTYRQNPVLHRRRDAGGDGAPTGTASPSHRSHARSPGGAGRGDRKGDGQRSFAPVRISARVRRRRSAVAQRARHAHENRSLATSPGRRSDLVSQYTWHEPAVVAAGKSAHAAGVLRCTNTTRIPAIRDPSSRPRAGDVGVADLFWRPRPRRWSWPAPSSAL
jgi:hypothetical protein